MDIRKTWQKMGKEEDDLFPVEKLPQKNTSHPLAELKKNLLYNLILSAMICAVYVWILFKFQIWQVQLAIGIVLLFSIWAMYTAALLYRDLDPGISSTNSLLAEMEKQHRNFSRWMDTQQLIALFIYPISVTGGFLLGGLLGSEKPISEFMNKPLIWIVLAISISVLTPACYYLAKWMFNYSFGKQLKRLEENIADLKQDETSQV